MGYILPFLDEAFEEPLVRRDFCEPPSVVPSSYDDSRFWSKSARALLTSRAAFLFLKMA